MTGDGATAQGLAATREPDYGAFEDASHWRSLAVALVKTSRDCVKLIDLDGAIMAMSPAGLRLLQFDDPASVVGVRWEELWGEPERSLVSDSVARGAEGFVSSFQGFCATARGEPRWWEVQVAPVVDEEGVVRCLLANSRDVTELREREQEMQNALKRQRQALLSLSADFEANSKKLRDVEARVSHDDRLRVFGRFVGGVVHDFNNVFAAVHGAARLLRRRTRDATVLDVVDHVERAAERGAGLARHLLDFARSDDEATEVFDPAALVARDAHLLRHIVAGEATLDLRAEPDVWHVLGAPQKFQSVLFNLVANARDAIRANGRVEVSLVNCPLASRPEGLEAADYVALCVADDGCGMSPEALARAGEPFFTTKPPGKGTGLGLASAFELAAACGGRASVESAEGVGARVCVYMRRSPVEGEEVAQREGELDPTRHGGAKLLLVEDDPMIRDHLAGVFRGLHYVVVEASAVEIAAAAVDGEDDFDLVITDINLKDGLGDRLVADLRARQPALPAIYITGASDLAMPRGETVLQKPVSETRLARAVLEKLGRLPGACAPAGALAHAERIADKIEDPEMRAAMAVWRGQAQASGRIPSGFDPGPWADASPSLGYVLAVGPGVDPELRFVKVGGELPRRLGRPLLGATLTAGDEHTLGPISRVLRRRLDGEPGYDSARFSLGAGKMSVAERLLLPLADAEGRVSHLFGLMAFNEADA